MIIYFVLTALIYCIYASIPFWNINESNYLYIMPLFSLVGGILWSQIASQSQKNEISSNGLIFDAIITVSFFIIPALVIKQDFTGYKMLGIGLVILGIILIKR